MPGYTLLQINARVWCGELASPGDGLDAVPDPLFNEISERGYDAVWLMGVWTTGELGRSIALEHEGLRGEYGRTLPDWQPADVIGSPYAIKEYRVAESLGGNEAIRRFRQRLEERGIQLILDFVPNHTARDHSWVERHPGRYVNALPAQVAVKPQNFFETETMAGRRIFSHGRDPYFDGWTDTAQLDYRNPETRSCMTAELLKIAQLCDGVRCDMAMLVLSQVFAQTWSDFPLDGVPAEGEFWADALDKVRALNPDFKFIGEAYWGLEGRLVDLGFDFVYDKTLYDALVRLDRPALSHILNGDEERLGAGLRFLENHDEARAADAFPAEAMHAVCVTALTLPGARLIQRGQERGARVRLPVQLGRAPEEPPNRELLSFYDRFLPVATSETLRRGQWRRLSPRPAGDGDASHVNILAWRWKLGAHQAVVCAVNFSAERSICRLPFATAGLAGRSTVWRDVMDGAVYERSGDELIEPGLYVDLAPYQVHVLVLSEIREMTVSTP